MEKIDLLKYADIEKALMYSSQPEEKAAKDSGVAVVSECDGVVEYADAKKIVIKTKGGKDTYYLNGFERSNAGTCYHQIPIVRVNDTVTKGMVIADGPSTDKGELALGKNMTIAFMTCNGYNYEDAVVLNERLVKEDIFATARCAKFKTEFFSSKTLISSCSLQKALKTLTPERFSLVVSINESSFS